MSEFEVATIAFQNASLMAIYVQAGVALLVGLVQCALIAYGLRMMKAGNADRAVQTEALQQQGAFLAEIGEGLREQSAALRELLRRGDGD